MLSYTELDWGAFNMNDAILGELHDLWRERERVDEYFGTLINAWLERGGKARVVRGGESYVDVGTFNGYREATSLLAGKMDDARRAVRPAS